MNAAMQPVPCRVTRVTRESADTVTIELAPPGGRFPFRPGQFNMLYAFGVGESAISLSGDCNRPETLVHTIRDVGAVTHALTTVRKGASIGVRGPFGRPWPIEDAHGRDLLVVAGGIGLAPLRPAIYEALHARERFRRVAILCGAKTPADLIYPRELARWRSRFDVQLEVIVDAGGADWRGDTGLVTALLERAAIDPAETVAMICGPEPMMAAAARALAALGMDAEDVYLTMERNMKCGIGFCGHCQLGPTFVCKDGPVFRADVIGPLLATKEL